MNTFYRSVHIPRASEDGIAQQTIVKKLKPTVGAKISDMQ